MGKINISGIINFVKHDIWRIRVHTLPRGKGFLIRQIRVVILSLRGFIEDNCQLKASALTFFSLLSIVPVFAMAFGIAKGFGFEKLLEQQIMDKFDGQGEIFTQVIDFAESMLANTQGGIVAGIGIAVLFWTVIKVLGNIEKSFNDIWGIKNARKMSRKFSDYLSVMIICPVLLILSSSITVFISTQVKNITGQFDILGVFTPVIFIGLKLMSYCISWVLFTFLYSFLPNTKVKISSAIMGGIVAGTIYEIVQWGYINFQVGVAKYNAIYGSFAAVPLFLVWLQMSWLIVLLGAEISFASQNVDTYEFEPDCLKASHRFKLLQSLRITHMLVKDFVKGSVPLSANQIAHVLEMPIRLVRQILFDLVQSSVVTETINPGKENGYHPALDVDQITVKYVIDAVEERGMADIPVAETEELDILSGALDQLHSALDNAPGNKLLRDI